MTLVSQPSFCSFRCSCDEWKECLAQRALDKWPSVNQQREDQATERRMAGSPANRG